MRVLLRVGVSLALLLLLLVPTALGSVRSYAAATDQTNLTYTSSSGVSSQYHVYAANVAQPAGLLLQFHGDGAYEFKNPTSSYSLGGTNGIVAQARKRGYITVPVLSPDKQGSITWWESGSANADYVRDLVAHLKGAYSVRADDIWLVGYSGGAQFITQFLLPRYPSLVSGGGSVVFGGGGAPRVTAGTFASGMVANFPMHWYTGAADTGASDGYDALSYAKAGEAWYANRGFRTSHEYPAGVAHDLSGRFGGVVAAVLDANRSATPSVTPTPTSTSPRPSASATTTTARPTSATPTPSPATTNYYVTGYSWWDNDPPGSAAIAYPILHQQAAGTGTYADPITAAVGSGTLKAGTRVYIPKLSRYFIVEDLCASCTGAWIDVWADGRNLSESAADQCLRGFTGTYPVIVAPPQGLTVTAGAVCGATTSTSPTPTPTVSRTPTPTPTVTPSAPTGDLTGWAQAVTPTRTGVTVRVVVPAGESGRTRLYVYDRYGSYSYTSTYRTGTVDLTIASGLRSGRSYTFEIVHDGDEVGSGSFTTLSGTTRTYGSTTYRTAVETSLTVAGSDGTDALTVRSSGDDDDRRWDGDEDRSWYGSRSDYSGDRGERSHGAGARLRWT